MTDVRGEEGHRLIPRFYGDITTSCPTLPGRLHRSAPASRLLPVRSVLRSPLNHVDELVRDSLVRLLRRMQLVIPQEVSRSDIRLRRADRARRSIAEEVLPCDVGRGCQVGLRIVVYVGDQAVHVKDGNRCSRVALPNQQFIGRAVLEDAVYNLGILFHLATYFRDI